MLPRPRAYELTCQEAGSGTTQTVSTVITIVLSQIRFQPNDHKTIKETADELKIFEGIKHPNLVRYFGVELHRVSSSHCTEQSVDAEQPCPASQVFPPQSTVTTFSQKQAFFLKLSRRL